MSWERTHQIASDPEAYLERLKPLCETDTQRAHLEAYVATGKQTDAAESLGVTQQTVSRTIIRLEKLWAKAHPELQTAPKTRPGFATKRLSTFYDLEKGVAVRQWHIQEPKKREFWHAVKAELRSEFSFKPIRKIKPPKRHDRDLLRCLPYGDPHVGLYSWNQDSEDDWDLDIASRALRESARQLITQGPKCGTALVMFLGDFFHSDNQSNTTNRSKHQLDVDSRYAKVLRVGMRTAESIVEIALHEHEKVHVIVEIGNHDDHTALFLALYLETCFRENPRVFVDTSPARYHYYRFHNNLIGTHHGDLAKVPDLPAIMADDRSTDWGETEWRVWYTGHDHQRKRYDLRGCEAESFQILAPRDAYAEGMGFRNRGRAMDSIIRCREDGEVSRQTIKFKQIERIWKHLK